MVGTIEQRDLFINPYLDLERKGRGEGDYYGVSRVRNIVSVKGEVDLIQSQEVGRPRLSLRD